MRRAVAAVMAMSLLSGCGGQLTAGNASSSSTQGNVGAAPGGGTFLTVPLTKQVLQLRLLDAAGQAFTLASLHGRYVILANFMTTCQDICPMTTANMRAIGDAVRSSGLSDKVSVLELSIDAQRDTAARMAAYQHLYSSNPSWMLASGTASNLQALWSFFGAPAQRVHLTAAQITSRPKDWQTGQPVTYDVTHADLVLIIDPNGTWRWLDLGAPQSTEAKIPAKLQQFLTEDGRSALAKPQQPTWTVQAVLAAASSLIGQRINA